MRTVRQHSDFALRGYALIGQLVVHYSRLDLNVALFIAGLRGSENRAQELARLENTSFKLKLSSLMIGLKRLYREDDVRLAAWQSWVDSADELRCRRNDLMHGRWDMNELTGLVTNVVGLPDSPRQIEVTYSLEELAAMVERAASIADELLELRRKQS